MSQYKYLTTCSLDKKKSSLQSELTILNGWLSKQTFLISKWGTAQQRWWRSLWLQHENAFLCWTHKCIHLVLEVPLVSFSAALSCIFQSLLMDEVHSVFSGELNFLLQCVLTQRSIKYRSVNDIHSLRFFLHCLCRRADPSSHQISQAECRWGCDLPDQSLSIIFGSSMQTQAWPK